MKSVKRELLVYERFDYLKANNLALGASLKMRLVLMIQVWSMKKVALC
jgi:hypothetical protein